MKLVFIFLLVCLLFVMGCESRALTTTKEVPSPSEIVDDTENIAVNRMYVSSLNESHISLINTTTVLSLNFNESIITPTNASEYLNWSKLMYSDERVVWVMQKELFISKYKYRIIVCIETEDTSGENKVYCEKGVGLT